MATRREARERALALCYELEAKGEPVDTVLAELPAPPDDYTVTLVRGVGDHRAELDQLLGTYSERWAVDRMPAVDRALLRIGSYELGWEPALPVGVVIDEAVELARQYSTADSARFVHALLARIADHVRA